MLLFNDKTKKEPSLPFLFCQRMKSVYLFSSLFQLKLALTQEVQYNFILKSHLSKNLITS